MLFSTTTVSVTSISSPLTSIPQSVTSISKSSAQIESAVTFVKVYVATVYSASKAVVLAMLIIPFSAFALAIPPVMKMSTLNSIFSSTRFSQAVIVRPRHLKLFSLSSRLITVASSESLTNSIAKTGTAGASGVPSAAITMAGAAVKNIITASKTERAFLKVLFIIHTSVQNKIIRIL